MTTRALPASLLAPAVVLSPEQHWEGVFHVTGGRDAGDLFHVKARIGFHGELIEGAGHAYDKDGRGGGRDFTLSGANAAAGLSFHLWFEAEDFSHLPLDCAGALAADGAAMEGDWTFPCMNPAGCGCGGGGGDFKLKRVAD